MVSAVNTGSLNMPKMLRHLSHRTSQVRDLVFVRDAINRKEVMTTKDTNKDGTRSESLSGPAVSFGYETNSSAQQDAGTNLAYHVSSPELVLPGLKAIQSPITSRSGQHERSGHRITGECKFYLPPLDYIKQLENFSSANTGMSYEYGFDELETFDKLIDMERILLNPDDFVDSNGGTMNVAGYSGIPGFEIDRVQFTGSLNTTVNTNEVISQINIIGTIGGSTAYLRWSSGSGAPIRSLVSSNVATVFDLPVSNVKAGDTTTVWQNGVAYTYTASISNDFDVHKLTGQDDYSLTSLSITTGASPEVNIKNIFFYKEAEWRIDSIKEYRNEYIEVRAVRVRGNRTSRRRAYG